MLTDAVDGDDNDSGSFIRPVVEGEVLRKIGVRKLNRLLLPEPERSQNTDDRYLMCIDERDCELFVPVAQSGLFYEVSDGNFDKNENSVMQITDVLDEMVELPLYVRHILGDPPPISKLYLPSLKLVRVKEEETVMGATLECDDDKLPLEIQTNSTVKFEIALNTPMLQSSNEYTEALELCKSVSQSYVTEMKLAVNFKMADGEDSFRALVRTRLNAADDNLDSVTNSQRTSIGKGSEIGDVEANSEFNIQWEPSVSVRSTPVNHSTEQDDVIDDCESIYSIDSVDAERLNSVLGGTYFESDHRSTVARNNANAQNVSAGSRRETRESSLPRGVHNQNLGDDVIEEVTDFSVCMNTNKDNSPARTFSPVAKTVQYSSYSEGLNTIHYASPTQPFESDTSVFKARKEDNKSVNCQNSRPYPVNGVSFKGNGGPIPGCNASNKNCGELPVSNSSVMPVSVQKPLLSTSGSTQISERHHLPYIFTGDVFINSDSYDSLHSRRQNGDSYDSLPESIGSWDTSKLTFTQTQNQSLRSGRTHPTPESVKTMTSIHSFPSPNNLITFDEPPRTPSASSIVTCKAADEMVTSCKDLRLSLEEITRTAHDKHVENSWNEFCLERSSSLPVRSKSSPRKPVCQDEEHSHSWEQISPRRDETTSLPTSLNKNQARVQTDTIEHLNTNFDNFNADKTQLISEASSENSLVIDEDTAGDSSFTLSESDLSVTDGHDILLAAFEEIDNYLDSQSCPDSSVKNASTLSRDKAALTQKMKIKQEIKRKQTADWNEIAEII